MQHIPYFGPKRHTLYPFSVVKGSENYDLYNSSAYRENVLKGSHSPIFTTPSRFRPSRCLAG